MNNSDFFIQEKSVLPVISCAIEKISLLSRGVVQVHREDNYQWGDEKYGETVLILWEECDGGDYDLYLCVYLGGEKLLLEASNKEEFYLRLSRELSVKILEHIESDDGIEYTPNEGANGVRVIPPESINEGIVVVR